MPRTGPRVQIACHGCRFLGGSAATGYNCQAPMARDWFGRQYEPATRPMRIETPGATPHWCFYYPRTAQ